MMFDITETRFFRTNRCHTETRRFSCSYFFFIFILYFFLYIPCENCLQKSLYKIFLTFYNMMKIIICAIQR
jgi:hypothetical protein